MSLNAAIILPPLQQVIFDKTLDTFLSNGTVFFWEDANRTVPKNVYTLVGTGPGNYTFVSLGPVLTLSGIGSYIDANGGNIAVYLWPFTGTPNDNPPSEIIQNYYITVYSSTGVIQFDIPNWPGVTGNASPINEADTTDNIISNPQFVDVNFPTTATSLNPAIYTTTGTNTATEVAPDWSVITTGNGSFSVYQQVVLDQTAPSNPPFALGIFSAGYSQPIQLRQRIFSPRIFAGQFVSGSFIAESTLGGAVPLTMNYTPSITGIIQQICTGVTLTSGFTTIANFPAIQITNPGGGSGFVDITIVIPVGASVQISSVQLCGVTDAEEEVAFLEQTPARQVDHLFHYFQPLLNFKPIPSYLVGWDFPLNPAQFFGRTVGPQALGNNTSYYAWDQTILFQSISNSLSVGGNETFNVIATANTQFALIQYLSAAQMTDIVLQLSIIPGMSSNVRLSGTVGHIYTISLWWTANNSLPSISANASLVTSLDSNGHPNVAAGWHEVLRTNQQQATFTHLTNGTVDYPFSGWMDITAFSTAKFFAIVVGTGPVLLGNGTDFKSISLVPGAIATPPAPQTQDEVLRECQYYYEKSYPLTITAGTPITVGAVIAFQNSELFTATNVAANFYQDIVFLQFKQVKRVGNAAVFIYSVNGVLNDVTINLTGEDSGGASKVNVADVVFATYWTPGGQSDSSIFYTPVTALLGADLIFITPNNTQHFIGTAAWLQFQYVIDARLGVV